MAETPWHETASEFLNYLDQWMAELPLASLAEIAANPSSCALISVDMINGFCHRGPLSSPRAHAVIRPIVDLMTRVWSIGVHHVLLSQDTHEREALEFGRFPAHCLRGTPEAETIPEIRALSFHDRMLRFEKNSISSFLHTGLEAWVQAHPEVLTYIVVGVCTDLCTYHLAMHLLLEAYAKRIRRRVVLPDDCVDTYDLPIEASRKAAVPAHHGDFFHHVFLYSMALNGVEVVAGFD